MRAIGASNYRGPRLAEAIEAARLNNLPAYQSLQPLYNLFDRAEYEDELEAVCQKYGLAVVNYYPLAAGFLTGKYRSADDLTKSPRGPSVARKYLNPRGLRILEALDRVAKDYDTSQASIAMAWLLMRPSITAPIASATSVAQLEQITAATDIELDPQALALLSKASAPMEGAA